MSGTDINPGAKKTRGRPPKDKISERLSNSTQSSLVIDGAVGGAASNTSELCNRCGNDSDKWISCERCLSWFCLKCADLTDDEHSFFSSRKTRAHWYCDACESQAVKAVTTDQAIEEKCKEFLGSFQTRLEACETNLSNKADKSITDSLTTENKIIQDKILGLQKDISNLGKQIKLTRFEPVEKEKRKNNIVIRGLPETGNSDDDEELVKFILSEIECPDVVPIEITRLGKIPATVNTDEATGSVPGRAPARPIRCVLRKPDQKPLILNNAKKIRNSTSDKFDSKRIFIIPDQTALEREDDILLRKRLDELRNKHTDKKFIIKGKKITECT